MGPSKPSHPRAVFLDGGLIAVSYSKRRDRTRLMLLLLIVLAGVVLARLWTIPSGPQIRVDILKLGYYAPPAFILVYAISSLLFLPKAVLSILAGVTFGLGLGIVYVLIGAMIGATVAFLVSRFLARESVEHLAGNHLQRLDRMIAANAFSGIVIARLIPVIPFTLLNYAAGLTAIGIGTFAGASVIGMLPGTFITVSLGAFGVHPRSWQFLVAVGLAIALAIGGTIAIRRRNV